MSVSITELICQAKPEKKSKQGVVNLRFVVLNLALSNTQWDMGNVALSTPSARCQQYLET
jgi:hypothetical protein